LTYSCIWEFFKAFSSENSQHSNPVTWMTTGILFCSELSGEPSWQFHVALISLNLKTYKLVLNACAFTHSIIHHIFIEVILPARSVDQQMNKTWSLPLRNSKLVEEAGLPLQCSMSHKIFRVLCKRTLYCHTFTVHFLNDNILTNFRKILLPHTSKIMIPKPLIISVNY
jgi:hypothetical protein